MWQSPTTEMGNNIDENNTAQYLLHIDRWGSVGSLNLWVHKFNDAHVFETSNLLVSVCCEKFKLIFRTGAECTCRVVEAAALSQSEVARLRPQKEDTNWKQELGPIIQQCCAFQGAWRFSSPAAITPFLLFPHPNNQLLPRPPPPHSILSTLLPPASPQHSPPSFLFPLLLPPQSALTGRSAPINESWACVLRPLA